MPDKHLYVQFEFYYFLLVIYLKFVFCNYLKDIMLTYIALLRGINVSGQKKIKMADLKLHLEELNFENITTYIQSGNIIFTTNSKNIIKLEKLISDKIKEKYGFDVDVIIKTLTEFEYTLNNNPFIKQKKDPTKIYLTFLHSLPTETNIDQLKLVDYSSEEYIMDGKNIFFYAANGYGTAKMNNNFFEKKLKVIATTRNWKTINKLFELSQSI